MNVPPRISSITTKIPNYFKKKIFLLIPIIALIGLFAWFGLKSNTSDTPNYQTALVEKGTLVVSVTAAGQISSTNSRPVTTNVSGVVKKIHVKNDQEVSSGASLLEIELDLESQQTYTQALAAYQSAKNNLAAAQANQYSLQANMLGKWDTFKELAESEDYKDITASTRALPEFHIPEKEWLAAEAQYKNQQSVVAQAQTALNSASQTLRLSSPVIYAPISGKLSSLSLQVGSVISGQSGSSDSATAQTLARITTQALPTITVNLSEIDVTKIELNNKVTITLDALTDKTYTGKVISIDTAGVVSSGVTSYPAVIAFDTEASDIFSNMSAQASIITDMKSNILLIPSSTVQTQNGVSTVRVMRKGQVESVPVETGLSSETQTEITTGLTEGDTIVTSVIQNPTTNNRTSQTTSPFSGIGGTGGAGGFGGGNVVRIAR